MGLFSYFQDNKKCVICGGKTSSMDSKKIKNDKYVCSKCRKKMIELGCYISKEHTKEDCIGFMGNGVMLWSAYNRIVFSDSVQKIYIMPTVKLFSKSKTLKYDDVVGYELLSDNEVITSGGLGRAVVGGALLGIGGAIVGGVTANRKTRNICEKLELKITVKGEFAPAIYIKFLDIKAKTNSSMYQDAYKEAQDAISQLEIICSERKNIAKMANDFGGQNSPANEILKYKQLLDMGAITQSEFNKKKKQLLEQ